MLLETALRVGILLVLAVVVGYVWHVDGRGRWWETLTDRFVLGVPWGSLVTLALVVSVYLFVQSGIESWGDPVVLPFRSWSYSNVLGMLAAGFTHAGPGHLLGNLLGALVLSPLVEYAWGHYPPGSRDARHPGTGQADQSTAARPTGTVHNPPSPAPSGGDRQVSAAGPDNTERGPFARPVVRALLLFPLGIVGVSLLTSLLASGWSLGYSGTVFFLLGVAVMLLPLATVVAMVTLSGVTVVFRALQTPILQVSTSPGVPGPPSWVGVNVQAHLVGFLLGTLVAFVLLRRRDRWPDVGRLALAVVLVVLVRNLWSFATGGGGTFTRWQGVGVIFVLFLAVVIVAMVSVEDRQLVGPVTLRSVVVGGVVAVTVLIALLSLPANLAGMDEEPVPDTDSLTIADYTVTYAEGVPHGRASFNDSGVIVVSEQRDIWSSVVRPRQLAHHGSATATVGGIGWREVVDVERTGWRVVGNDSVYTVALEHDDRRVQAFRSDPRRADARVAGHNLTVVPASGGFRLRLSRDGAAVDSVAVPAVDETRTVDVNGSIPNEPLTVTTEERDGTRRLVVAYGDTRVPVAEAEGG